MKAINLFEYIIRIAGENIEPGVELDLADLNGDVKNLSENKDQFVLNMVKERETYILVKVDKNKTIPDAKPIYTPLFSSDKISLDDFLNKLNSVKKNKNFNPKNQIKNKQQTQQQTPMLGRIKKNQSSTHQYSTIQSIEDTSPIPADWLIFICISQI